MKWMIISFILLSGIACNQQKAKPTPPPETSQADLITKRPEPRTDRRIASKEYCEQGCRYMINLGLSESIDGHMKADKKIASLSEDEKMKLKQSIILQHRRKESLKFRRDVLQCANACVKDSTPKSVIKCRLNAKKGTDLALCYRSRTEKMTEY
ncbi:hypothetical protein KJ940_03030 [Myxococcota bacterium]|nr:hypothetical protein [Myxococcota bacterium]